MQNKQNENYTDTLEPIGLSFWQSARPISSLRAQGSWLFSAKLIGLAFSFALPIFIVRVLQQHDVGTYRQAFQLITNLAALLPIGMSMSAYYYLVRDPKERNSAVLNILIFNAVMGLAAMIFMIVFPDLVGSIFNNPDISRLSHLIGLATFLWVFSSLIEIIAVANGEIESAAFFITFSQFSRMTLMSAAVFFFGTVDAFLIAAVIQGIIQSGILLLYLTSRFPKFWKSFDLSFLRRQLAYAIPYGASGMLWIIQTDIHSYFVGNRFSPSDYAIYAYGCLQIPLIAIISESVTSLLIPRMSELQSNGKYREILLLAIKAMQILAFYFFPLYVLLLITSKTLIISLLTSAFAASVPIFIVNLTLLPTYIWVNDPIIRSFGDLGRFLLRMRVFNTILLITILLAIGTKFGLLGVIVVVVAISLFEKAMLTVVVLRRLQLGKNDVHLFKPTLKIAISTIIAGFFAALFYSEFSESLHDFGFSSSATLFGPATKTVAELLSGSIVIGATTLLFLPIYLACTRYLGVLETGPFDFALSLFRRRMANSKIC